MEPTFLTDFGLAKATATGSRYTRTGEALGTPAYMSPEQARGDTPALGPATDVWSLGCVLYELLAGRRAFDGGTAAEVVAQVLTVEPPPIRWIRTDVPSGVGTALGASLAKSARHRYASARELRDDLDRLLRGERVRARRHGRRAAIVTIVAATLAGAGGVAVVLGRPAPDTAAVRQTSAGEAFADTAWATRFQDPRAAAAALATALAREPTRHDWRVRLGLLRWATGDPEAARSAWSAVPEGVPAYGAARFYLGLEGMFDGHGRAEDFDRAIESGGAFGTLARGALAAGEHRWQDARLALRDAAGWEAAVLRGYVEGLAGDGDRRRAVQEYSAALEAGIPLALALVNRGALLADLDDGAAALADLDRALALAPGMPTALANRGMHRRDTGDLDGAVADLEAAVAATPGDARYRYSAGLARERRGDYREAVAHFDAALAADPAHVAAHVGRADALVRLGDAVGARAGYDAAIALAPTDPAARHNRGVLRGDAGDLEGALADYDVAVATTPRDVRSRLHRASVRSHLDDLGGALADLDILLTHEPGHVAALHDRGVVRGRLGDLRGALVDFDDCLARDPAYTNAYINRARTWFGLGDLDRALADYDAALARAPEDVVSRRGRAQIRNRRGAHREAAEDLRAVLTADPGHADVWASLAQTLEALPDRAGAVAAWREFLRLVPDHPDAAILRQRIASLESGR